MVLPDGTTSFQALQNALRGSGAGRARLLRLRPAPPRRLRPHRRRARGAQAGAVAACLKAGRADAAPLRLQRPRRRGRRGVLRQACRLGLEGIICKRARRPLRARPQHDLAEGEVPPAAGVRHRRLHRPRGLARAASARCCSACTTSTGALVVRGQGRHRLHGEDAARTCERAAGAAARGRPRRSRRARIPGATRAHWVEPKLVAEVAFTEWTSDGRLRHPSFQGLREDKKATEVVRERPRSRGARRRGPATPGRRRARRPGAGRKAGAEAGRRRPSPACASPTPTACVFDGPKVTKLRPRPLLRGDRRPHPPPRRGPAADPRALPRGRGEAHAST